MESWEVGCDRSQHHRVAAPCLVTAHHPGPECHSCGQYSRRHKDSHLPPAGVQCWLPCNSFTERKLGQTLNTKMVGCCTRNKHDNPHGGSISPPFRALRPSNPNPLSPLNIRINPCHSTWTQNSVLLWWGTPSYYMY